MHLLDDITSLYGMKQTLNKCKCLPEYATFATHGCNVSRSAFSIAIGNALFISFHTLCSPSGNVSPFSCDAEFISRSLLPQDDKGKSDADLLLYTCNSFYRTGHIPNEALNCFEVPVVSFFFFSLKAKFSHVLFIFLSFLPSFSRQWGMNFTFELLFYLKYSFSIEGSII